MARPSAPHRLAGLLIGALGLGASACAEPQRPGEGTDMAAARARMVEQIRSERMMLGERPIDPRVLDAVGSVPRHRFVPEVLASAAYEDRPLPIGERQTISQPSLVAWMTDLLDLRHGARVLEVGTGSGYQAAVLSPLAGQVFTIEIVPALAARSRALLAELGYANVTVREGDGYKGWPDEAPFDAIVVTAGATHLPPPLVAQLKPGGRMVIPVGATRAMQDLIVVTKAADGSVRQQKLTPVVFVPLTGEGEKLPPGGG